MNDIFEKHNWHPETFETKKAIRDFFKRNHISEKRIKKINTIGFAANMTASSCEFHVRDRLAKVGVPYEVINSGEYPWFETTLLPCEADICEPVVIVFDDGTTLEMKPIEGQKLQMSVNQINENIIDGTNQSNYHSDILFQSIITSTIRDVSIYWKKIDRTKTILFQFWLWSKKNIFGLFLRQSWEGWFTVGIFIQNHFHEFGNEVVTLPYATIKKTLRNIRQIVIVEGHDGGSCFWIMPVRHVESTDDNYEGIEEYTCEEISIDEDDILHFLAYFLKKYFDDSYDYGNARQAYESGFKWHLTYNLYTYAVMETMLQEIEEKSSLLEKHFEDESLAPLLEYFNFFDFLPYNPYLCYYTKDNDRDYEYTKKEEREIIKDNIHIATDFYSRFVRRMRSMLRNSPEYSLISFMGP